MTSRCDVPLLSDCNFNAFDNHQITNFKYIVKAVSLREQLLNAVPQLFVVADSIAISTVQFYFSRQLNSATCNAVVKCITLPALILFPTIPLGHSFYDPRCEHDILFQLGVCVYLVLILQYFFDTITKLYYLSNFISRSPVLFFPKATVRTQSIASSMWFRV